MSLKLSYFLYNYYALFHSHMSYCCQVWGQHKKTSASRVLTLQKITFSNFWSPSSPIFLSQKVLPVFDYVKLPNVILIHQIKNKNLPMALLKTFDLESLAFNVRNHRPRRTKPGLLKLPIISTVFYGNHSVRYQCVVFWNLLQSFLNFDDLSRLSLNRLKYFVNFYFLSSYSWFNLSL